MESPSTDAVTSFAAAFAAATKHHKLNDTEEAIRHYRSALELQPSNPEVCMLLGSILLAQRGISDEAKEAASKESNVLAETALKAIPTLKDDYEKATMYARYAHYLLTRCNGGKSGGTEDEESSNSCTAAAQKDLAAAVLALKEAIKLSPSVVIAWKNLATAYRLLRKFPEAEEATAEAVRYSRGKNSALLYSHALALKRVDKWDACVQRFCDVIDARKGDELSAYWIRVVTAAHKDILQAATVTRAAKCLESMGKTLTGDDVIVPHEYVKRLFDGYAKTFESHLTGVLNYKTPTALLKLALSITGDGIAWNACADLGCGTGLAGVEFRRFVRKLCGVDLSGGMVDEARRTGLYDRLDVAALETWLEKEVASNEAYDLVVAADVLVYISALDDVFKGVSTLMQSALSAGTGGRPLFIFSTEADTSVSDPATLEGPYSIEGVGYKLTGTGRCVHQRAYVLSLGAKYGFKPLKCERQPIRKNAGVDVIGDLYVLEKV